MKKISLSPGNFKGLGIKKISNYRQNMKTPKLGGGEGIKPPAVIAKALGVDISMPVHKASVSKLTNHPDTNVAKAAQRLMKKF